MSRKKTTTPAPDVGAQTDEVAAPPANDWPSPTAPVSVPVPVDLVDPNPHQPRKEFDPAKLEELSSSIKECGVIQPIIIEPAGDRFILHAGERRLRASKLAGLSEIPAYIVPPGSSPKTLLVRAVVENVQRADMNPLELAKAFQEMADEHGLSDSDIARQVGKSRSVVANTRRLLQLPPDRQAQVAGGELSERQAMALLPLYQLPAEVQEKVSKTWHFMEISAKPEKFNSDEIRSKLKDGLGQVTAEIKLFTPDEELNGAGVRHSKCTDCPFYLKALSDSPRCTDSTCNEAKHNEWKRRQLEQAKVQTGFNFVDPARELTYRNYTDFYTYNKPILDHALACKCPNLVLHWLPYGGGQHRPEGVSEYIEYICLHPGKGGCACEKALKADKVAAEKLARAANEQVKSQVVEVLTDAVRSGHQGVLWAIYSRFDFSDARKIKQSKKPFDAAVLARKIAKALVDQNIHGTDSVPEAYRKRVDAWLVEMDLNHLAGSDEAEREEFGRRLSRIEEWVSLPIQAKILEAIRGNLTNLSRLAEDFPQLGKIKEGWPTLAARFDEAKSTLLMQLVELEAAQVAASLLSPSGRGVGGEGQRPNGKPHDIDIGQQFDMLTAWLEGEQAPDLTELRYRRALLQELFTTYLDNDLPETAALMVRWEELADRLDERIAVERVQPLLQEAAI